MGPNTKKTQDGKIRAGFSGFVDELQRRGVFRVCSIYMVAAWGASMGAAELFPAFGAPDSAFRWFVIVAALGVPVTACLAWSFDMTTSGIVRDHGPQARHQARRTYPSEDDLAATQILPSGAPPMLEIRWQDDRGNCRKLLNTDFIMGRGVECEISFDDPRVSRKHARVTYVGGKWWIEDLESANGTRVNGSIVKKMLLPDRSEVRLSDTSPIMSIGFQVVADSTLVVGEKADLSASTIKSGGSVL